MASAQFFATQSTPGSFGTLFARFSDEDKFASLQQVNSPNRPIGLTQCCTQFKSPGDKIFCVLHLHYNVAFTFK